MARATMLMRQPWSVLLFLAFAGCGGAGGGGDGTGGSGGTGGTGSSSGQDAADVGSGPPSVSYQPLAIGATWTYDTVDQGVTDKKIAVVQAYEDVGGARAGTMAYRWQDTTGSGKQLTWYVVDATTVGRVHDQSFDTAGAMKSEHWYDPFMLRVDVSAAHLQVGATWSATYNETVTSSKQNGTTTAVTDQFTVAALDESVTVKAGTFSCLKLVRHDPVTGTDKTYWFAAGVGKVKETNGKGGEELQSYSIP